MSRPPPCAGGPVRRSHRPNKQRINDAVDGQLLASARYPIGVAPRLYFKWATRVQLLAMRERSD